MKHQSFSFETFKFEMSTRSQVKNIPLIPPTMKQFYVKTNSGQMLPPCDSHTAGSLEDTGDILYFFVNNCVTTSDTIRCSRPRTTARCFLRMTKGTQCLILLMTKIYFRDTVGIHNQISSEKDISSSAKPMRGLLFSP